MPIHRNPKQRKSEAQPSGGLAASEPVFRRFLLSRSALLLFLLALAYRAGYLLEYRHSPFWCLLFGDPQLYHERALEILRGDFWGHGVSFHSSPLYPYFLALVYRLFGVSIGAVFVVQSILDAFDVVLVAAMARILSGRPASWVAGIALAFWPTLAYFSAEQLELTLVLLGVHLALLFLILDRQRELRLSPSSTATDRGGVAAWTMGTKGRPFYAGLALGLAVLGKPNSALFLPVWFLWQLIRLRGAHAFRAAAQRTLPLVLGIAATVLPFTLRNLMVNHDLVLTSANGGINLYIGNNDKARGIFWVPTLLQGDLYQSSSRVAEDALGRSLKASEVSAYWARQATSWIAGHPFRFLALCGRKILLLVNALEISNHFDPNFLARDIALARISPFRFGLLAPFAFWGIALALARLRRSAGTGPRAPSGVSPPLNPRLAPIPLLWLLAYSLSLLPFFMTARYRTPVVPTMIVFSAFGLLDLAGRVRAKRIDRAFAAGILVLAAGFGVTHLPLNRAESFYFNQYQILGADARDRGDLPSAVGYYRQAIQLEPRSVIAHNSLANCLARLGRTQEAETQLLEATGLDPTFPQAWRNLAAVRRTQGDPRGERTALETAVRLDPRFQEARSDLVKRLLADREYEAALEQIDAGLKFDPRDEQALWNRALLLGEFMGRQAEAAQTLNRLESLRGPTAKTQELRKRLAGP